MSEDRDFARALAEALGPLYRVSLKGPNGRVAASFGIIESGDTGRREIPLPGSARCIVIEVDPVAVQTLARISEALDPKTGADVSGSFTQVDQALEGLIALAETQIGRPISKMDRADKQRLVRFLDQRGAFALRKSVEAVADVLGVSRFTVYNYLDSVRQS